MALVPVMLRRDTLEAQRRNSALGVAVSNDIEHSKVPLTAPSTSMILPDEAVSPVDAADTVKDVAAAMDKTSLVVATIVVVSTVATNVAMVPSTCTFPVGAVIVPH